MESVKSFLRHCSTSKTSLRKKLLEDLRASAQGGGGYPGTCMVHAQQLIGSHYIGRDHVMHTCCHVILYCCNIAHAVLKLSNQERSTVMPHVPSQSTCSLLPSTFVKHL